MKYFLITTRYEFPGNHAANHYATSIVKCRSVGKWCIDNSIGFMDDGGFIRHLISYVEVPLTEQQYARLNK